MTGTTIFKMPAQFARDNYPVVRDQGPTERPAETPAVAGHSETGKPASGAASEHVVVTEYRSLLSGGGARRTATA